MKKKVGIVIGIIIIIAILVVGIVYLVDLNRMNNNEPVLFSTWGRDYEQEKTNTKLDLVLSLEDEITGDSAWYGTFNLIWNDLKKDLAKQDIVFNEQSEIVNNLNKGTFTADNISEEDYYKVYGKPSLELKEQIEKEIKRKFGEESDILNEFEWENANELDYFLYAMLFKEFEFPKEFKELENGEFANYDNVKYFGIDSEASEKEREQYEEQVEILYYNSKDSFAVKLKTKGNDEVIIAKGNKAKSFGQMYENITKRADAYTGPKYVMVDETLKIPNINFNLKEEITEVENKPFRFSNGLEYRISKAMQTIEFELNSKGGRIKSEAGMYADNMSAAMMIAPRQFVVDDEFALFLIEKDKDYPYFAAQISDISNVQNDVVKTGEKEERSLKVTFDQYVTQADVDRVESIEVIDEAKEIQDMIYNADFSEETCDGVSIYSINFENGENYGLEIFDENCHITYGNTEAVLTKEDSQRLKEILDKYTLKNVTMDVKDGSLTRNGVTVIITDTNKEHYSYDEWYRIDKFEVDGWQELEPITDDYAFTDIAWLIGEDNTLEDKVDWSDLYGELEDGRYRLVKKIYDGGAYKYFSMDFYLGDDTEIIN